MDSHPDIAAQVRKNPTLLVNYDYLQNHPELNAFLKARPRLNTEISQNSVAFMHLEDRLDQPGGRRDLAELDRFMDSHPSISAQLKQKPWLATNYEFLQSHPDLNTFLQNHPQLRTEIGQNPVAFMQEENSFDRPNRTSDAADFNRFLDTHREVGEQVRKNPYLVNDRTFVKNHPDLRAYFQQNPGIRDELNRNPNAFAPHEQQVNYREYQNNDARDLSQFDHFLDSHREIAEQVRKNPSLADDRQFVENHPALQNYLRDNPGVRDEIRHDPNAFMHQEDRFDASQHWGDRDVAHQHMASFGEFLEGHQNIRADVTKNPSMLKNREYVQKHPELGSYLSAHPEMRDEMMSDPDGFVKGAQEFKNNSSMGVGTSTNGSGSGTSTGTAAGTSMHNSTGTSTGTGTTTQGTKPKQ
jgi:hypothetical protein